jgi:6-phosphogluconolactonase
MTRYVYVGAETRTKSGVHRSQGIFVYRMNTGSGELHLIQAVESGENPTFLALHPNRNYLYAVNEVREGLATAFALDPDSGRLQPLNSEPINGIGPCYVSLSPDGEWLLAACYSGGSLSVLPVNSDGQVGKVSGVVQHTGSGVNPQRQEAPHAHSVLFDPSGRFVLACDLGTDKVHVYSLDREQGTLVANDSPYGESEPGAGPRHIAYHPSGKWVYVATEMGNTVETFAWDSAVGKLERVSSISSLPADFTAHSQIAHILISPDGRSLYASNRGHNSLAVYAVAEDGSLSATGFVSTGGNWPRNFAITPDGKFILVANQESDSVVVFAVDAFSGMPAALGAPVQVTKPMFVMAVDC